MDSIDTEPFALDYHKNRLALFKAEEISRDKIVFAVCSITEFGKMDSILMHTVINFGQTY